MSEDVARMLDLVDGTASAGAGAAAVHFVEGNIMEKYVVIAFIFVVIFTCQFVFFVKFLHF